MNEQTLKLLDDPENFVRQIAERVVAELPKEPSQPEEYIFFALLM